MGARSAPLNKLGDPRWWTLAAQALALLEPLPPGPELVSALTELAVAEVLQGRNEAGLGYAEQALSLAGQLGIERPARALGFRGLARSNLGDHRGLDDFREAITLATQAGQGREVALLHNNLGSALLQVEGPVACLEALRAGIAFAEARGLTGLADHLMSSTLDALVETGEHEQVLALASELAARYEASGDVLDLSSVRSVQALILTLRGQAAQVADTLDWLEAATRKIGNSDFIVGNLAAAAFARAALGEHDPAAALLAEIETNPGSRESPYYSPYASLRWCEPPSRSTTRDSRVG